MGKKLVIAVITLIMASTIWMGAGFTSSAADCTHSYVDQGKVVGDWSGSHDIVTQSSQGTQRCYYTHVVYELYFYCTKCGHTIYRETIHDENHTICGSHY